MARPRSLIIAGTMVTAMFVPRLSVARPLAVEDYYRVVSVQAPAMSPDGRWVAFVKTTLVEAENRRQNELWLAAADASTAPRRLSDPSLNVSAPRWSPDGRLLAYSVKRRAGGGGESDAPSIWFLHADRLDDGPFQIRGVDGAPIFSPDNKWI